MTWNQTDLQTKLSIKITKCKVNVSYISDLSCGGSCKTVLTQTSVELLADFLSSGVSLCEWRNATADVWTRNRAENTEQ